MEILTPFNEQLLQIEVIDQEGIKKIREQINSRYETLTSKQKASILAKTIYDMIDHSLPNFSTETKKRIRMELLNKKLSTNSLSISADDIIKSSIAFATQEELKKELPQWVHKKVDNFSDIAEMYIDHLLNNDKDEVSATYSSEAATQPTIHLEEKVLSIHEQEVMNKLLKHKRIIFTAAALIIALFFIVREIDFSKQKHVKNIAVVEFSEAAIQERMSNELPTYLQYEQINEGKLRDWLNGRNSLLADDPYFSTIIEIANEYNIHPLLLFAITGQEQGFVLRDNKNAAKIANNPFNVFHSWEDFNTNISDTSQIAARTIVNLSKDRPADVDPIQWINRKYAEDENWWRGVSSIFKQLKTVVQ